MDPKLVVLIICSLSGAWCLANVSDEDYNSMPKLFQFDNYEKCLFQENDSVYCTVTVQLKPKNVRNSTKIWNIIEKVSADKDNYRHDLLRHGVCVPTGCPNETIFNCLNDIYAKKYTNLGLKTELKKIRCETKHSGYSISKIDVIFAACLGLYVVFIIFVSLGAEFLRHQRKHDSNDNVTETKKTLTNELLSTFSLFENWRFLINVKMHYQNEDFMPFLQGLRFLVLIGVVVTHALEINVVRPVQNPRYVEEMPTRYITNTLANGGMMVQIYFVISAFLFTVSYLKKIKNKEKIHFGYVLRSIFGRFLRLTPMYALTIALHSTWLVHLARGPFWDPLVGEDYRICAKNWWKNLLFFNNFVINDGMCLYQSWYLSVDLQFYILGILTLWMTQKKPKLLFLVAGLLTAVSSVIVFIILFWNNWEIAVKLRPELMYYFGVVYSKEWQATWSTTYSNLPGLASGICCGYVYLHYKTKNVFAKTRNKLLWWIGAWGLSFVPLIFSSYYMTTEYYSNSRLFAALYGSVIQIFYTIGCAIVIFGMALGVGGYVKKCLEWSPMIILGQLAFGVYIVHFTILKIDGALNLMPIYVSDYLMINDVIRNMTISYAVSAVMTLLFQIPILRLSKFMLS